jgi:hypothetical protein
MNSLAISCVTTRRWSKPIGPFYMGPWVMCGLSFYPRLRERTLSRPQAVFEKTIRELSIDELFEMVGKTRRQRAVGNFNALSFLC